LGFFKKGRMRLDQNVVTHVLGSTVQRFSFTRAPAACSDSTCCLLFGPSVIRTGPTAGERREAEFEFGSVHISYSLLGSSLLHVFGSEERGGRKAFFFRLLERKSLLNCSRKPPKLGFFLFLFWTL
jgi:hypothetical protein